MGVVHGRPLLAEGVDPFVNLPREAIESLWTSYNLLGEGWSLGIDDLRNVFSGATYVTDKVGFTDDNLKALFTVLDTDKNNLIDALELFTTLAVASGMDTIDKISFVFAAFDLGGRDSLSYDGKWHGRAGRKWGCWPFRKASLVFNALRLTTDFRAPHTTLFSHTHKQNLLYFFERA